MLSDCNQDLFSDRCVFMPGRNRETLLGVLKVLRARMRLVRVARARVVRAREQEPGQEQEQEFLQELPGRAGGRVVRASLGEQESESCAWSCEL